MGRDKSKLRLGRYTLAGWLRRTCESAGLTTSILRRDLVPRCGPLGGIWTGLRTTRGRAVVFVSCDMPFLTAKLLRKLVRLARQSQGPVFCSDHGLVGFPLLLWKANLPQIEQQLNRSVLSLQSLAKALPAVLLESTEADRAQRLNVNTPEDWEAAQAKWAERRIKQASL